LRAGLSDSIELKDLVEKCQLLEYHAASIRGSSMRSSAIPDIRPFIANDQSAVRYYFAFTLIVIAIGLVIVGLSFVPPFKSTDSLADIAQRAFGGVFSCLSWIPIKELLARRRVGKFQQDRDDMPPRASAAE
jgi:hypothetical protein